MAVAGGAVKTAGLAFSMALAMVALWALRPESSHGAVNVNDPTAGQVFQVAVDTDTTGNPTGSAGLIPSLEFTTPSVPIGNTHLIDVIVDEVHPTDGFAIFGFNLKTDPNVVRIVSKSWVPYMQPGGFEIIPAPIPDQTGNWRIDVGQVFANVNGEGVLVRIGIECVGNGTSVLDLADDSGGDGIPNIRQQTGAFIPVLNDTDGQIVCGTGDNCPGATPWLVPVGDTDCDGSVTGDVDSGEVFFGTDPDDPCSDTPTMNDERGSVFGEPEPAWPPDINDDQVADFGDVLAFAPHFNKTFPDPNYNERFDFYTDGTVDFGDVLQYVPYFNKDCADYFDPLA